MNIQKSQDYSCFKRIKGNRGINKAQVAKLRASFGENPNLASAVPILVNDKMEIVDGQHRYTALKELGLPVYYMVKTDLDLSQVQILNSATKTWTPLDYAKSFSELGKKHYDLYMEFRDKYHLSHNILLSYLGNIGDDMRGGDNTTATFRKGQFKVANVEKSHELCKRLIDIQKYHKRGDTRAFAVAFKIATQSAHYDHKRMMKQAAAYPQLFKDSPYAEDYMRQLEKIYNYHAPMESRVRLF